MKNGKVRYAVIGCGEHAWQSHVVPAQEVPELELVALCDPLSDRTAAFEAKLGTSLKKFTDERDLLADPEIDAVVIASPDRFHAASLNEALGAGKHVLVEKPLAVTKNDLLDLDMSVLSASDKALVMTSCHPRRFDAPYVWVKDQMPALVERLGPVLSIDLDFSYHKPSKTGLHAGLLADHLNHEFDFMNFLLGHAPTTAHKLTDDDVRYHVAGGRADGVTFSFHGTRMLESRDYPEFIRIRLARGDLKVYCKTGFAELHDHDGRHVQDFSAGETDYKGRFRRVMANFAGSILGTCENYLTPHDLILNSEICVALTEKDVWRNS